MIKNYLPWVARSAQYDLIVTFPFAIPGLAEWVLTRLASLHQHLGLSGSFTPFLPEHMLFVHLLGSLVVVWSLLRLRHPSPLLGLYDGFARILFSTFFIVSVFSGASQITLVLLGPEVFFAIVQCVGYYHWQQQHKLATAH